MLDSSRVPSTFEQHVFKAMLPCVLNIMSMFFIDSNIATERGVTVSDEGQGRNVFQSVLSGFVTGDI